MKITTYLTTAFTFFIPFLVSTLLISTNANSQKFESNHANHRTISKLSSLSISSNTQSDNTDLDIEITFDNLSFSISLQRNLKLTQKLSEKQKGDATLLKGVIKGMPNSWVRLTLADGFYSGAFYDGSELYFIDPKSLVSDVIDKSAANLEAFEDSTKQVIYKTSDVELDGTCALEIANLNTSAFDYSTFTDDLTEMTTSVAGRSIDVKIIADTEFNTANSGAALNRMLSEMNVVDGIFSE